MLVPAGYHKYTGLSSAKDLTDGAAFTLTAAMYVVILKAEGAAIRWRDDGVAPTASTGMPLAVGVEMVYHGPLSKLQFIEQSASATLNASFYQR